jgi:hypothetical protein
MKARWLRLLLVTVIVPALVGAGGCGGSGATTPTAQPTSTPVVTVSTTPVPSGTTSPEDEIMTAYLGYWDLYAAALLHLDQSLVSNVTSGEETKRIGDEIAQLRQQGVASRIVVKHRPVVLEASPTSAVVYDEMTNNSFYVDPKTLQPPAAAGSGNTLKDTFFLEKVNGQWIVTRSVRQN